MSTPQIRVAFVDDEPRTLRAFRWEFGEHFHIKTFLAGSELLAALAAGEQFDVLISDQRMPGMTGDEVLKEVSERYPPIRRLVMTAYADVGPLQTCVNEAGIDGYLEKPWDPDEVRDFIVRAHGRLLQARSRELRRIAAGNDRWSAIQTSRISGVAQLCKALGFDSTVKNTFYQTLELSTFFRPFDWSDLLLIDSSSEQELILDFLSSIESLMLLGSEFKAPCQRVLVYWWMLLKECPEGQGSSFFKQCHANGTISLSFDAGAPFGDSILDPCGDRDPKTIRRNALLLLVIQELQALGGSLLLVPDNARFKGDLLMRIESGRAI